MPFLPAFVEGATPRIETGMRRLESLYAETAVIMMGARDYLPSSIPAF